MHHRPVEFSEKERESMKEGLYKNSPGGEGEERDKEEETVNGT